MADEFTDDWDYGIKNIKEIFEQNSYIEIFDFLQWLIRRKDRPILISALISCLEKSGSSYRLLTDNKTFVPITSDEELETLNRAFADLAANEYAGARAHLRKAAEALTSGKTADSIRESIHAVESVARVISGENFLQKALQELSRSKPLHPALEGALNKLYGYTSDEKGIRHPLLDSDQAKVDEADAIFMIGACASFVSYLINKSQNIAAK